MRVCFRRLSKDKYEAEGTHTNPLTKQFKVGQIQSLLKCLKNKFKKQKQTKKNPTTVGSKAIIWKCLILVQ